MPKCLRISLKPGQRIYINGAEVRVDRKVSLELVNSASFLLDEHVIDPRSATTPMRRLYCAIQAKLIGTDDGADAGEAYRQAMSELEAPVRSEAIRAGLAQIDASVAGGRHYEALRRLRSLFPIEEAEAAAVSAGQEPAVH